MWSPNVVAFGAWAIISASDVKKMDVLSKSDVYAVVTFGLEEVRTSVREDSDACEWGEHGQGEWTWFFVPSTATSSTSGSVIVTCNVVSQLLASVIVTVCIPAGKPFSSASIPPDDQL